MLELLNPGNNGYAPDDFHLKVMLKRSRKGALICRKDLAEAQVCRKLDINNGIIVQNEHGLRPNGIFGSSRVGVQRGTIPAKAGIICGAGSPRFIADGCQQ